MPHPAAFLIPLALVTTAVPLERAPPDAVDLTPRGEQLDRPAGTLQRDWLTLDAIPREPVQRQVRIERRVIVRITPSRVRRQSLVNEGERRTRTVRLETREMGECVKLRDIAAVQTGDGTRLLLHMRGGGMVGATLEKACSARDFYSGFYVERNEDGMICIDRDRLQARSGTKCRLAALHRVVAVAR